MAEPNQHLIPPSATITKSPKDVAGDGYPLSDPNSSFTALEYSSSPSHAAEARKHSGPDPDNLWPLEEVDLGRRSLQTKIMNGTYAYCLLISTHQLLLL